MSHAVSRLQVSLFWIVTALLAAAVVWIALRNRSRGDAKARRLRSVAGIALQSIAFAGASFGFVKPVLPWWAPF